MCLVFHVIEINKVQDMHRDALQEVKNEQEFIHELEISNKIESELKQSIEASLKQSVTKDTKEKLQAALIHISVIKKRNTELIR